MPASETENQQRQGMLTSAEVVAKGRALLEEYFSPTSSVADIDWSSVAAGGVAEPPRVPGLGAAALDGAEAAMLRETDSVLARLESGVAREREAIDSLLTRLRQRAA